MGAALNNFDVTRALGKNSWTLMIFLLLYENKKLQEKTPMETTGGGFFGGGLNGHSITCVACDQRRQKWYNNQDSLYLVLAITWSKSASFFTTNSNLANIFLTWK